MQRKLFVGTVLVALGFGALSPVFREDDVAKIVGAVSAIFLVALGFARLFRSKSSR